MVGPWGSYSELDAKDGDVFKGQLTETGLFYLRVWLIL